MMFSRERRAAALATLALTLLAGCGGGDQIDPFSPARVLAFGDETSVIEADGRKYTVNFVSAATDTPPSTPDCRANPIWVQSVAARYGFAFPQCATGGDATRSRILASPDTGVAELVAQVDAFVQGDTFAGSDLVTMLTGANDVHRLHRQVSDGAITDAQAQSEATALGAQYAQQVNRVANLGAKVLVATIPDQGLTPEGRATAASAQRLAELSRLFNTSMRNGLLNDGRRVGLVLFDERVRAQAAASGVNAVDPACNDATVADVRTCTSATLRTGASLTTWLWADRRHLAPLLQTDLGSLAVSRAVNNPF